MLKIFLVALVTISAVAEAGRIRRETEECEKINVAHKECVKTAYDDYVAAHGAGDDGRGDWEARKSCNYVNAAVGDCGDLLSGCYGEEGTTAQKDHQVETILKQLERTVGGWDSSKCPVVREYLERQADNTDEEEEENGDGDQEDEEGADDAEEDAADDGEPSEDEADEDDGEAEDDGEEGDGEEGDEEAVEDDAGQGDEDEEADDDEADDDEDEEEESEDGDDENSSTALFSSFAMMMACLSVIA